MCFGVVRSADDIDIAIPTIEAQRLPIERQHEAVGGALGGDSAATERITELDCVLGIKTERGH